MSDWSLIPYNQHVIIEKYREYNYTFHILNFTRPNSLRLQNAFYSRHLLIRILQNQIYKLAHGSFLQ